MLKILFLSYQKSHEQIFFKVLEQLKKVLDVSFKVLQSRNLLSRPLSARYSYRSEIQYFERIVDDFKPDVLVVANDLGLSATFIRICKLRGIPSVAIQDGILTSRFPSGISCFLSLNRYLPWHIISTLTNTHLMSQLTLRLGRQWEIPAWGTGGATIIAAMGDYYKQVFVSRRVSPNRILVTGSPLFDNLSIRKNIVNKINDNESNKPVILLITQPFVEDGTWGPRHRDSFVKTVATAIKQIDAQLVIKVHPRENSQFYESLASKLDKSIIVTKDGDLDNLITSSDVVIAISSTAGLLAIVHQKPLIVLSYFPLEAKNILEDMAMPVYESEKLLDVLKQALNDKELRIKLVKKGTQSIHDHLYILDGNSSQRIAKLIIYASKEFSSNSG
jgi:hypothetical protein